MKVSNSRIDKAGRHLSRQKGELTEELLELEYLFDDFRKFHLEPLTELTLDLQNWLSKYGESYYIAQRLKRKPQIIRKLNRLSVRLSQLQDIGGCRIIVDSNEAVDDLVSYITGKIRETEDIELRSFVDYRDKGRDITGYRAFHMIIKKDDLHLELQIRSKIQHYWSESIERTSVIYGHFLKEQEGDPAVIRYFKQLSDIFYEIEAGRNPTARQKIDLDNLRLNAEKIIKSSESGKVLSGYVNDDIIRTLTEIEVRNPNELNNWILVFDWSTGNFVTWDAVGRDSSIAVSKYVDYEKQYTENDKFEVVMIGSSDIATVKQTHSHYFGIEAFEAILESLDQSIIGFSERFDLDVGARHILSILARKKYWGKKEIKIDTLRNHYCKSVITFDASIKSLRDRNFINQETTENTVSLNVKMRPEIEKQI